MTHQIYDLGDIRLQSGRTIRAAKLSYRTYGALNAARDNVILYTTSFAGTHLDAAWLIGPGRALDPERYFIIVPDMLGNGLSSSPSNTPAPGGGRIRLVLGEERFVFWDSRPRGRVPMILVEMGDKDGIDRNKLIDCNGSGTRGLES